MERVIKYRHPFKEYQADPGINASLLRDVFLKSPAHAILNKAKPKEQTPSLSRGSAIHTALLERDLFEHQYYCEPEVNRRTNEGKGILAELQKQNPTKTGLRKEDYDNVLECANRLNDTLAIRKLLNGHHSEVSVFWDDPDIGKCKARIDALTDHFIIDLKSTNIDGGASHDVFQHTFNKNAYWMSAGWYWHSLGRKHRVVYIAAELHEPFGVTIHEVSKSVLEMGYMRCLESAHKWVECTKQKNYPSYDQTPKYISEVPTWISGCEEPSVKV